jgi:hypothetical protein
MKKIILISSLVLITNIFAKTNPMDNKTQQPKMAKDYSVVVENNVLKQSNIEDENIDAESSKYYHIGFNDGFEEGKRIAEEAMIMKLNKMERYLDSLFNFQRLYIENKIEPPEIMIRKTPIDVYNNGTLMTIDQEQIEIIKPARLINNPKTWRNFLITN